MKKNIFMRHFAMYFLALSAALYCWPLFSQGIKTELSENDKFSLVTRLTARIIGRNHYRQHPLNDEISSQIFNDYFKTLDPNKTFFSQKDLDEFEPYRYLLDDMIEKGNFEFPFKVYDRFIQRMTEYQAYCIEQLERGFDFTRNEEYVTDRRELPRPKDEKELREAWRMKLKNELLTFRLMTRAQQELDAANKEKNKDAIAIQTKSPEEKIQSRLKTIYNEISRKEKFDILGDYLSCVTKTYGPHSGYFSPREEEEFNIGMSLSLEGIGATLSSEDGYTKVVQLVPTGPAAKDGRLQPEDKIIAVAQEGETPVDVIDMPLNSVVKMIRGRENSKVILTVLNKQGGGVPVNIELVRRKVELKEREAAGRVETVKLPDGKEIKVGFITLPRFYIDFKGAFEGQADYKSSTTDVRRILERFKGEGVDGVVMDMRFNGGGSLREAITLTGLLIKDGPIVQVRSSNRKVVINEDPDAEIVYDGPLVVLTSKMTSSAAEIFAGAIKDYKRGILIGDSRTYGKGTVLEVFELRNLLKFINQEFNAGSLTFENAVFYRINGSSTQQLGVVPDIVLPSMTEHMDIGESFNDNHLPWDSIDAVKHDVYDNNLDQHLVTLKEKSEKRIAKSTDFKKLLESIELFKRYKNRKSFSLNEEKRWAEYKKEQQAAEAQEKIYLEASEQSEKNSAKFDPVADEAVRVLYDYRGLGKAG
jgi:carboxyl-terminal processing protease